MFVAEETRDLQLWQTRHNTRGRDNQPTSGAVRSVCTHQWTDLAESTTATHPHTRRPPDTRRQYNYPISGWYHHWNTLKLGLCEVVGWVCVCAGRPGAASGFGASELRKPWIRIENDATITQKHRPALTQSPIPIVVLSTVLPRGNVGVSVHT
jgi:hypothetical protein